MIEVRADAVVGESGHRRGQRPGRRTGDSRPAAERPIVPAARAAAARRAGRAGGRQRRGRRPHAEDFDQRRAARAEQLPARRHRHQQRLQQDARVGGGRAARRRSGARVPGADQRVLGGVRPVGRRRLQRRHALGREPLHGSVFEFHRNSALDARNFFDPAVTAQAGVHPPSVRRRAGRAAAARPDVLLRRLRRADRAAGRHRRHGGARRQRAARHPRRPSRSRCIRRSRDTWTCCFRAPTAARSAAAAPSICSRGRSPPTSTSISCASITGCRPPTASSCAPRTIAPT